MKTIKKVFSRLFWMIVMVLLFFGTAPGIVLWGTTFVFGAWDYVFKRLED